MTIGSKIYSLTDEVTVYNLDPEPVSHGIVVVFLSTKLRLKESVFSGQDPVSTLSESMHKPDQGVCTWPEFSAFNF